MDQLELLKKTVRILESLGIPYMVVGSYGSGAWGEPRFTRDIDILVALKPADADRLTKEFPFPEFYLSEEAARDAVAGGGQFNVIHPLSGVKIDFILEGAGAWERQQLGRRVKIRLEPDLELFVAAAEDVIIGKMLYYREGGSDKHLRDIAGILKVSGEDLDRAYIERWSRDLGLAEIWAGISAVPALKP
jgi:predicted nucleotidyltransferase